MNWNELLKRFSQPNKTCAESNNELKNTNLFSTNQSEGVSSMLKGKPETVKTSSTLNALLGKGSEFEGKLVFEGTVRIDGNFKGEIYSTDTLIIGDTANIEADIKVDNIIVNGNVKGNITAKNKTELHAPGQFVGNIKTGSLMIEDGVIFNGQCTMDVEEASLSSARSRNISSNLSDDSSYESNKHPSLFADSASDSSSLEL